MKQSMLWCIIAAITKVKTSYKSSYLPVISGCLRVHNHTFLMMCKKGSNNLKGERHKMIVSNLFNHQAKN